MADHWWRWWVAAALALLLARCVLGVLRLPGSVEPRWYRLELLPRTSEGVFTGRVRVNLTCRQDTDTLVLHADESLLVSAWDISVSHPSSRASWSEPVSVVDVQRDPNQQLLVLLLSRRLHRHSSYSIALDFQGRLGEAGDHGFIRHKYLDRETNNTEWYAVTNMSLDSARKVFPCFDEPSYKATFEVSVGTPSHQHVFSNMPLADIENVEGQPGWYWKHFSISPLMSTFSIGIVVLEFEHFSLAEGSFHIVGPTAIENGIETTMTYLQDVYEYLQDYLDFPYPLLKLDIVFVPGVYRDAAASWGLIVLGEDSVTSMKDRQYLAQEMARQWVAHLASPRWRAEWRCNAGLAAHLGYQFLHKFNFATAWDTSSLQYAYGQVNFPEGNTSGAEIKRNKVFWLLRMLQHSLTKKTFRSGFHKFLKSRKYKTFTEEDVWEALTAQARIDRSLPQDISVEVVARSWLDKDDVPVLTVTRDYASRTFTVTQRAFSARGTHSVPDGDDELWYVPITYLTPNNLNISTVGTQYWMKNQRELTINAELWPAGFLIVNPPETGMFLVNYDATNWAMLADALQRRLLPTAVRAKLLHDALNLAISGELNFNSAMNLTLFLSHETEPAVWGVVDPMLDHVGRFLDGTPAGDKFKRYLTEQATASGAKPSLLRDCKDVTGGHAAGQREVWPRRSDKPSEVHVEDMCNVLVTADMTEFSRVLKKISKQLRNNRSRSHESAVSCFANCVKDSEKIHRALEMMIIKDNSLFTDEDIIRVLKGITRSYNGYKTLFLFLRQKCDILSHIYEDKPDLWRFIVRSGTSSFNTEEGLETLSQFYRDTRYRLGLAEAVVQASLDQTSHSILWTRKNIPVIEHWLNRYFYHQEIKPGTT